MAIVNGTPYDHIDVQPVAGGDTARHLLVDTDGRAAIAPNYADLTFPVKKGTFCWYSGALYTAKQDIDTSESWTASHWVSSPLANELSGRVDDLAAQIDSGGASGVDDTAKWYAVDTVITNLETLIQQLVYSVQNNNSTATIAAIETLHSILSGGATIYDISKTLSHCTISNTATSIVQNTSYSASLSADTGYTLGTVTVTMGGTDITSTAYNNGVISIASVIGNIVITASATANTYTVTNTLSNCTTSNNATTATHGSGYSATLSVASGYTFDSVVITMGDADVTSTVYNSVTGAISIASVTGNIVITASATARTVSSIDATFTQGGNTIYDSTPLNDLKQYLVVTATYSDATTDTISSNNYSLSGTLTVGTSTITVSYGGKTTTFNVTVTAPSATLSSISAVFNSGNTTIHASDTLDSLKQYLTVTATYSDSSTAAVAGANYTLSGTLTVGTSTVTVTYSGKTTTFNVTVAADPVTLSSISAAFNSGAATIHETDTLDSLKQYLTVTATYSDSSTATVASTDYTLSGTLSEGTSTITVSYGGKTTTFNVTVAAAASATLSSISASLNLNGHTVYENDTLDDLRPYLTVTAAYSDSSTATITSADYTLSGTLAAGTRTITVGYGGQTATFTVTVTAVLPSGYTRLAYVAASGAQYLDIGVTEGDAYNAKYEVMVTDVAYNKGNHILSGKYTFFPFLRRNSSGTPELGIKNRGTESISSGSQSFAWALNERHVLEGYKDNKVKVDGQEMLTINPGSADGTNNLYLFNYTYYAGNDYKFRGRLYWAKVYGANDTLLRDFIPCKNSQDVAGLYDLVTNTFYTSDTSTALIAGEVA